MNLDAPRVSTVEQIGAILFYSLEEVTALRTMFIYSHFRPTLLHTNRQGFLVTTFLFRLDKLFLEKLPKSCNFLKKA